MPQRADGVAADDEETAPRRRAGRLARVAVDDDPPGHHVLGDAGARVAVHAHGRELVHPGAVVAGVALDLDLDLGVEPARDRVRAVRVERRASVAGPGAPRARSWRRWLSSRSGVDREVDRPPRPRASARRPPSDERLAPRRRRRPGSAPTRARRRRPAAPRSPGHSDAIATQSSVSASTAGLHAIGSRSTANPSAVPTGRCRSRRGRRGSPRAPPRATRPRASATRGSRRRPRCRSRSGTGSPRGGALAAAGCGSRASRCGRGRRRARSRTDATPSVVTRLSVAMRVCPSACVPRTSSSANCRANSSGRPISL